MSAKVKLTAKLPGDSDFNGVDAHIDDLVGNPEKVRVLYVEVDVAKIVDDTDTGTRIPYLRVRRAELVGPKDQVAPHLQRMFEKAVQDRTGREPLPYDENAESAEDPSDG